MRTRRSVQTALGAFACLAFVCLATVTAVPAGAGDAPTTVSRRQQKSRDAGWRQLPATQRRHLEHVYRTVKNRAPDKDWASYRRLRDKRGHSAHFERFPSHWRDFLVRNARWAQQQIKKLPAEERERLKKLSPAQRAEATKTALRPRYIAYMKKCWNVTHQVFSPLELKILKQLPPRERAQILRQSKRDAFGLVSPWSWRKYQALGARKRLVSEFLLMPKALTTLTHLPNKTATPQNKKEPAPQAKKKAAPQKKGKK